MLSQQSTTIENNTYLLHEMPALHYLSCRPIFTNILNALTGNSTLAPEKIEEDIKKLLLNNKYITIIVDKDEQGRTMDLPKYVMLETKHLPKEHENLEKLIVDFIDFADGKKTIPVEEKKK